MLQNLNIVYTIKQFNKIKNVYISKVG